jgi:hypothetical protein
MKAISELDEHHPRIINHAQQHHSQIIHLEFAPVIRVNTSCVRNLTLNKNAGFTQADPTCLYSTFFTVPAVSSLNS